MGLRQKYKVSIAMERPNTVGQKANYAANGTVIGHLQPLDSTYATLIGGNLSKSFLLIVDFSADVLTGDKGVIALGDFAGTYFVKELKKYPIGSKKMRYKEVVIEEKDA